MFKLCTADGQVKKEFPGAISVQYVGSVARIWSAKTILAEVKLQPGEFITETQPRAAVPHVPST